MARARFLVAATFLLLNIASTGSVWAAAPIFCDVATAATRAQDEQAQSELRLATQTLAITGEFEKLINARPRKPNVPLGEQMNPEEANRFGNLQEKLRSNNLAQLIESKRTRDIRVIARMARLADQIARYGLELPKDEKSEDYFLLSVIIGAREIMPVQSSEADALAPVNSVCALEKALISDAIAAASEAQRVPGLKEAMAGTDRLSKKYPKPFAAEKMTPQDRQFWLQTAKPVIEKVQSRVELAKDLVRLARLETISRLSLDAMRQDQYEAPGDLKHSGATWNQWLKEGRVTDQQNSDGRIITMINDKIPADFINQLSQAGAATK